MSTEPRIMMIAMALVALLLIFCVLQTRSSTSIIKTGENQYQCVRLENGGSTPVTNALWTFPSQVNGSSMVLTNKSTSTITFIPKVFPADEDNYTCTDQTSGDATTFLLYGAEPIPNVTHLLLTKYTGESFTLASNIEIGPVTTRQRNYSVEWRMNTTNGGYRILAEYDGIHYTDTPELNGASYEIHQGTNDLIVSNFDTTDSVVTFICTVSSSLFIDVYTKTTVEHIDPIMFTEVPSNSIAQSAGNTLHLPVKYKGSVSSISWLKNEEKVLSNEHYSISGSHGCTNLSIGEVNPEVDSGLYKVIITERKTRRTLSFTTSVFIIPRITSFSTNSTCLPLKITVSHPIIVVDLVKVIIRIATAVNGESKIIERKFKINATMKNTIIELKESDIDKDVKVFDMQLHFALADVMGHPSRNSDLITTTCNGPELRGPSAHLSLKVDFDSGTECTQHETDSFYKTVSQLLHDACGEFSCRHANLTSPGLKCIDVTVGLLSFEVTGYYPAAAVIAFEQAVESGIQVPNATVEKCNRECRQHEGHSTIYIVTTSILAGLCAGILMIFLLVVLINRYKRKHKNRHNSGEEDQPVVVVRIQPYTPAVPRSPSQSSLDPHCPHYDQIPMREAGRLVVASDQDSDLDSEGSLGFSPQVSSSMQSLSSSASHARYGEMENLSTRSLSPVSFQPQAESPEVRIDLSLGSTYSMTRLTSPTQLTVPFRATTSSHWPPQSPPNCEDEQGWTVITLRYLPPREAWHGGSTVEQTHSVSSESSFS